jgi:hypothetical protein
MRTPPSKRAKSKVEPPVSEKPFWKHRVSIKRFFCMSTDWQSVMRSMNQIATELSTDPWFDDFSALDDFFAEGSLDRSSELLDLLYDYCDERRIWVD